MLMKLGCMCVCTGLRGTGWGVGGGRGKRSGGSCWKDIFDIHPCSGVTKTLSGTRVYIKNDATHKVCASTSTELALSEFTKERFEFRNALLREGKKETASQK